MIPYESSDYKTPSSQKDPKEIKEEKKLNQFVTKVEPVSKKRVKAVPVEQG
jgi:hypothetical protein